MHFFDNITIADLEAQCSGQPKSECKPTLDLSHKRQQKQRVVKLMRQWKDEEVVEQRADKKSGVEDSKECNDVLSAVAAKAPYHQLTRLVWEKGHGVAWDVVHVV